MSRTIPSTMPRTAPCTSEYKALADAEGKVLFGGRLGEYKYYDMDRVIESALARVRAELAK